jgi:urease accessory protein
VYTASYGGGLVGGDALRLVLRVGPGAAAFVSTQASTKVYRSERGTSLDVQGEVSSGARLIVWPDPTVCYAGSTYDQTQRLTLEPGASAVWVDWMTSGRRASGERWQFRRYVSQLRVSYDARLILLDSVRLEAGDGCLADRMGRFDVLASAVIVGPSLQQEIARAIGEVSSARFQRTPDTLMAAAPLDDVGCILRFAGRSVDDVGRTLGRVLSFVPYLLGDDPWARKW